MLKLATRKEMELEEESKGGEPLSAYEQQQQVVNPFFKGSTAVTAPAEAASVDLATVRFEVARVNRERELLREKTS
ncbi:hypothetical protein M0802_007529 [Mischocyttarus mexicanus]|nr:hypothetical protein M0802_007529 [Mischocyttarus mexicanus]